MRPPHLRQHRRRTTTTMRRQHPGRPPARATTTTRTAATATAAVAETTDAREEGWRSRWIATLRSTQRRLRWVPASLRTRILVWFIGALALATIASVAVTYQVLLLRLDQRIHAELSEEAEELRRLAAGNDPETGEPFGPRVGRIFEVYLQRNIPSRNEAHITFVDGSPFLRSPQVVPYRLDADP